MRNRPGVSDRIGISGSAQNLGRSRQILTKDGGEIDAEDDYQYNDPDARDLNMNVDVNEPARRGERELDMDEDGVYQRLVRTQNLLNDLPENFFLD